MGFCGEGALLTRSSKGDCAEEAANLVRELAVRADGSGGADNNNDVDAGGSLRLAEGLAQQALEAVAHDGAAHLPRYDAAKARGGGGRLVFALVGINDKKGANGFSPLLECLIEVDAAQDAPRTIKSMIDRRG